MKKIAIVSMCLVAFLFVANVCNAETIVLQQGAGTLAAGKIETGLLITYGTESWTVSGVSGDNKRTDLGVSALFKYALANGFETKVILPYTSYSQSGSISTSNSGVGQTVVGAKLTLVDDKEGGLSIGTAVDLELPTGDPNKNLGEGSHILVRGGVLPSSGFNPVVMGVLSQKFDKLVFHVNLGYKYTSKYSAGGDVNTGDIIIYGLVGDLNLGGGLSLVGEVVGTSFGKATVADVEVSDSNGTTLDGVAGIVYKDSGMKIMLGVPIAAGDATYRTYDWKVVSAVTFIF